MLIPNVLHGTSAFPDDRHICGYNRDPAFRMVALPAEIRLKGPARETDIIIRRINVRVLI